MTALAFPLSLLDSALALSYQQWTLGAECGGRHGAMLTAWGPAAGLNGRNHWEALNFVETLSESHLL